MCVGGGVCEEKWAWPVSCQGIKKPSEDGGCLLPLSNRSTTVLSWLRYYLDPSAGPAAKSLVLAAKVQNNAWKRLLIMP